MPRVGSSRQTRPGQLARARGRPSRSPARAARARRRRGRAGRLSAAQSSPTASSAAAPGLARELLADPLADEQVGRALGQQRAAAAAPRPSPRAGSTQPGGGAQQGALAGAVSAHQRDPLAGLDRELEPAQDLARPDRRRRARPRGRGPRAPSRVAVAAGAVGGSAPLAVLGVGRRLEPARASAARASFTETGGGAQAGEREQPRPGRRQLGVGARAPTRSSPRGVPSKAIRPASSAITRSAAARQRSSRCSASSTPIPHSSFSRRSSPISSSPATGSSCEVGSSSSTSRGRSDERRGRARPAAARRPRACRSGGRAGARSPSASVDLLDRPRARRRRLAAQLERQLELAADGGRDDLRLGLLADEADEAAELGRAVLADVEAADLERARRPRRRGSGARARSRRAAASTCREPERPARTTNSPCVELEVDLAQRRRSRARVAVGEARSMRDQRLGSAIARPSRVDGPAYGRAAQRAAAARRRAPSVAGSASSATVG